MGYLTDIQPEGLQYKFSIRYKAASAQFRARMAGFFQDERMPDHFRRHLRKVQRSGDSGRACAYNDDVKAIR